MQNDLRHSWYLSPFFLSILLILLVFGFSFLYWPLLSGKQQDYLTALYMSMSTITTLGYGDIVISDPLWRFAPSVQALLAIILMGLFLNAAWHRHIDKTERNQKRIYQEQLKAQNLRLLRSYCNYLRVIVYEYETSVAYLTSSAQNGKMVSNSDFKFSSLYNMYLPTFRFINPLEKTRLEVYRSARLKLSEELKYIASRFDLSDFEGGHGYPGISDFIAGFLTIGSLSNAIESLLSYNQQARDSLKEMLAACADVPKAVDSLKNPTLMTPAVMLYEALKNDLLMISWIKFNFRSKGIDLAIPSDRSDLDPTK